MKYYPFVLGAQPVRMIDLAAFYAAIANEGLRVDALRHRLDRAERPRRLQAPGRRAGRCSADGDRAAFYQLRTMLQGVVARGTAASMKRSRAFRRRQDRHHRKRERRLVRRLHQRRHGRGLGRLRQCRAAGARSARGADRRQGRGADRSSRSSQAIWQFTAPKTPLPPPSAEAARHLKALPIDYASGQRLAAGSKSGFTEYFRLDANKRLRDTQYALAGRPSLARGEPQPAAAAMPRRTRPALPRSGATSRPPPAG